MAYGAANLSLYDSVLSSNIPHQEKSQIRKFFDHMFDSPMAVRAGKQRVHGTMSAFRQGSESLLTGAALAVMHVEGENGLDVFGGVPADAVVGFGGLIGSALAASSDMAPEARNIGSSALTVFGFRQMTKLLAEKRLSRGKALPRHLTFTSSMAGDVDPSVDPIINAARHL